MLRFDPRRYYRPPVYVCMCPGCGLLLLSDPVMARGVPGTGQPPPFVSVEACASFEALRNNKTLHEKDKLRFSAVGHGEKFFCNYFDFNFLFFLPYKLYGGQPNKSMFLSWLRVL